MGSELTQTEAEAECSTQGAHLTAINTPEENEYLRRFAAFGDPQELGQQPWIGLVNEGNSWKSIDGSTGIGFKWPSEGAQHGNCALFCPDPAVDSKKRTLFGDESGIVVATSCNAKSNRYICRMRSAVLDSGPQSAVCDFYAERTGPLDCECKSGTTDILKTNIPINKTLKYGELCVPSNPCASSTSLSLLFVLDGSGLKEKGYKEVVSMIEQSVSMIPKTSRVGFINYAHWINSNYWLRSGWSEEDFRQFLPKQVIPTPSNTFIGLQEAAVMFKGDSNKHKIIVLFTGSIRKISTQTTWNEYEEEKQMAFKMLKEVGVHLLLVTYGQGFTNIQHTDEDPSKLVENAQADYFPYHLSNGNLSNLHMAHLLRRVCEV